MNNEIGEKFLPLGTVVMLKGASKRLMITGFCSMAANEGAQAAMYDYSGCMYPEGFISSEQTALFNHDQIDKVYYVGLVDDEEKQFKAKLNELLVATGKAKPANAVQSTTNTTDAPKQEEALENIPPIGPGLPGYVAPTPTFNLNTDGGVASTTPEVPSFEESGLQEQIANLKFDE